MAKALQSVDMMRMSSASAQARAISQGQLKSQALLASEAAAIDKYNSQLKAFVQRVRQEKHSCLNNRSLLAGTSFAVKDNIDANGLPTHAGLLALHAFPAKDDATVVARLKHAGLVFTGKLNMSPMALGASTHNRDFGDCNNPHRSGFSAGGSSGGSASAVAAGLVGIALGTDTMGSVRLPAAFCGVVGFKPSWGRLPVDGLLPLCAMLDHIGVLSRTVEDAALAYSIMCADPLRRYGAGTKQTNSAKDGSITFETRDAHSADSTSSQVNCKPATIRLGVVQNTAVLQLQQDVEIAYRAACENMTLRGYDLTPVDISNIELSSVRRAGLMLCEAELLTTLEGVYPDRRQQLPVELLTMLDYIHAQSAKRLGRSVSKLAASRYVFEGWMDGLDALVLPTCAHTAFPMNGTVPADTADLTVVANVLGAPAISLPLPIPEGGLPIGLQLVGHYGHDEALLALSRELEPVLVDDE